MKKMCKTIIPVPGTCRLIVNVTLFYNLMREAHMEGIIYDPGKGSNQGTETQVKYREAFRVEYRGMTYRAGGTRAEHWKMKWHFR